MSAEVGSAHIAIFPVMRGFKKAVAAEVKGSASEGRTGFQRAFSGAGQAIGQRLGRETAAGFKQATGSMGADGLRKLRTDVAAASRALSSARLKQQDSAGKTRIAETQLAEAQAKYAAGSSQVVRAEERLASARRRQAAEAEAVSAATDRLKSAQGSLAAAQSQAAAAATAHVTRLQALKGAAVNVAGSVGRFRDGFTSAAAAASVFSGRMGTLGGQTRQALAPAEAAVARVAVALRGAGSRAFTPLVAGVARFRDGIVSAATSAAGFVGRIASFGGLTANIAAPIQRIAPAVASALAGVAGRAASAFSAIAPAIGPAMSGLAGAVGAGMAGVTRAVVSGASSMASTISSVAKTGAATLVAAFAAAAMVIASQLGSAVSRVDTLNNFPKVMANLGYSADDARASVSRMADGIKGLPTRLDDIASTTQQLAPLTKSLGDATELSLALNNALLAGGKGGAEASRAMIQYTQMLGKGKVDLQSWRTLQEVMPGQLGQIAQALLGPTANTMALYDAMKEGTVSFDDFNNAILQLNNEGINGFASFTQQAKDATAGIKTAFTNVGTAVSRNIANIIQAIGADRISGAINSIGGAIDAVGNKIVGLIRSFQGGGFSQFAGGMQGLIPVVGGVVGAFAPLLSKIPILGAGFAGLTGPIGVALGAFAGFAATSKPFQDALSNIASVLADSFGSVMVNLAPAFEQVGTMLGMMGQVVGGSLASAFNTLAPVLGLIAQHFIALVNGVMPSLIPLMSNLAGVVSQVIGVVADVVAAVLPQVSALLLQMMPLITQMVADLLPQLLPIITQIGALIQALLPVLIQVVSAVLPPIIAIISALLPVLIQVVSAVLPLVIPVITQIAEVIAQLAPILTQLVSALLPPIMETVTALVPVFMQVVSAVMQIVSAVLPLLPPLVQLIGAILPPLVSLFSAVIGPVITLAGQIIGNLMPVITSLIGVIQGLIDFVTGVFTGNWTMAWNGVKSIFSNAVSAIAGLVTGTLKSVFTGIPSMIKGVFAGAGSWLLDAGRKIIQGLIDGIKGMISSVQSALSSLTNLIPSWKGPEERDRVLLRPAGRLIMQGLEEGLADRYAQVRATLTGFTDSLAGTRPTTVPTAGGPAALPGTGSGVGLVDALASAIIQALGNTSIALEVHDVDDVLMGSMDARVVASLREQSRRRGLYR